MIRKDITRVTVLMAVILLATAAAFAGDGGRRNAAAPNGAASGAAAATASVTGVVSDVNGTTIKILNGQVTIDATNATIVSGHKSATLTPAMITVGRIIEVRGTVGMTPGTITATTIEVKGLRADGSVRGPITAIDATNNTITVLGLVITINPQTKFEGSHGAKLTAADLTMNTAVEVSIATLQNTLVAIEIELAGR